MKNVSKLPRVTLYRDRVWDSVWVRVKAMPHITMDFNVANIASSARIIKKSSTISLRVAGPLV